MTIKRRLAWTLLAVLLALAAVLGVVRVKYGGGEHYAGLGLGGAARVPAARLERLAALDYPPGNVAVSRDGRIFFNTHPFAKAGRFADATMFELVDGKPVPYPNLAFQHRYQGVFGMTVDRQNRLWLIEPAGLDHERTRLIAFDLATGMPSFQFWFPPKQAQFAQDLRVADDGATVYLADTGLFKFTPASLIVFDVASATYRKRLAGSATAQPQDWVTQTRFGDHKLAYGLLTFSVGLDGIALSDDGVWLYYGAMNHDTLYKVPTASLRDSSLPEDALAKLIVKVGRKPLSDGIALDKAGNVLVTDIEHGAVMRIDPAGVAQTLVQSNQLVWADGIALAPDGAVLLTDSAIPAYIDQLGGPPSLDKLAAGRPYGLFRIR